VGRKWTVAVAVVSKKKVYSLSIQKKKGRKWAVAVAEELVTQSLNSMDVRGSFFTPCFSLVQELLKENMALAFKING
jgi:hypothetical protein